MPRKITQRELRNESGEIMRALDRGETFVVTRNGVPVGELMPLRQRQFVAAEAAIAIFDGTGHIVMLHKMDNTQYGSIAVAEDKARTALDFRRPSKATSH